MNEKRAVSYESFRLPNSYQMPLLRMSTYSNSEPCVKCVRIRSYSGPYFPAFPQSVFSRLRQLYYNIRNLLQNASILLENAIVITKCDIYCKMCHYI